MRRLAVLCSAVLLAIAVSGCGSGSETGAHTTGKPNTSKPGTSAPGPSKPVLSESGACGDAYFWASNPGGTLAVTVTVEVRQRSHAAPTTVAFTAPDPTVKIEIQRGRNLLTAFCSDVITQEWHVDSRPHAVAGRGRITVDPPRGPGRCGSKGRLHLDGLVSSDGTRFAPIDVRTASIGCYAG